MTTAHPLELFLRRAATGARSRWLAHALGWAGLLAALATDAAAQPAPRQSSASREFLVEGTGGAFEVPVHPDFVTVLYFPDAVISAQASDKENFTISAMKDTISLRPIAAGKATRANLNVATQSLKITVILLVAKSPDDAVAQVFFKKASEERAFQRRVKDEVERRTAALRDEYIGKLERMSAEIRSRTELELAERLLRRHEALHLEGIDRNDANVIVRVKRAAMVGDDAFLFFEIQNRSGAVYRLASVVVKRGNDPVSQLVRFEASPGEATGGTLGQVPDASRRRGVVVVRDADRLGGKELVLLVAEPGGKNEVRVAGIRLR